MFVLEVLPLSPGAPAGTLSYRSAKKIGIGSIVTVTLRRRRVPGVVVSSQPALEAKASLKTASFMLSGNISDPIGKLPKPFMETVQKISAWHAAAEGAVVSSLLQEVIAVGNEALLQFKTTLGSGHVLTPLELPLNERAAAYRRVITESAEKGEATLFVVSTLAEIEYWKREFADIKPIILSGAVTGARREAALLKAHKSRGLVISTPAFSFVPLQNLGHVIIERIGAGGFRLPKRPYLDLRTALFEFAREYALHITYGDFPLPLEYRAGTRRLPEKTPAISIIDTKTDPHTTEKQQPWSAVPLALRERIQKVLADGGRVVVLAVRKGYAPVVTCRDCSHVLRDERGAVYAFTQEGGERKFRTSDGAGVIGTKMTCPNCDSWNLLPLGVGVERVAEELATVFPEAPLVLFDADSVRTATAAKKRLAPLEQPGSIAVGTEAMVPWLLAAAPAPFSLAGIASADSLLALPFWRARERFIRLAYLITSVAPEVIVCTRVSDDAAMRSLKDPTDTVFFEEETSLRTTLGYPPFGTLISLQVEGSKRTLDQLEEVIRKTVTIGDASPQLRAVPDRLIKNTQYRRTFALMLSKDMWPNPALSGRLASLPPSVRVLIDPESFW